MSCVPDIAAPLEEITAPTRGELAQSIWRYELREEQIIEALERHPVTEYALQ